MLIDLVQTKNTINLGFDKLIQVKIHKITSRNQIQKIKEKIVIIEGGKLNREILESKKPHILLSPEKYSKQDSLHQRISGLNHILCKLARKNKVAIGINFNDILYSKDRTKLLGKIMQNIRLCRKYKVRIVLATFAKNKYEFRAPNDLIAFAQSLGMTSKQAKDSLNFNLVLKDKENMFGIKKIP